MTEGYQPSHDVEHKAGRPVNWKNDLAIGKQGEQIFESFLDSFYAGNFEVKFDQYRNGRMVIETEQNPRGKGWKPSGINVTQAEWWIYLHTPGSFNAINVKRLKKYLEKNDKIELRNFATRTENPTKGYLLLVEDVHELMNSKEYDIEEK